MSKVIFNSTKSNASQTRVPARATTLQELNVVVKWNSPSDNVKAPVGVAVAMTPSATYEITLFKAGDKLSMSSSRDYLCASIPYDLQSAILEKAEALMNDATPFEVAGFVVNESKNTSGAIKGFIQVDLGENGKLYSFKFGVSNKNGKAFVMVPQIYIASEDPAEEIEDNAYLTSNGKITKTEDGRYFFKKSDVRSGGISIHPELYKAVLAYAQSRCIERGWIAAPMTLNAKTETVDAEVETEETITV